MTLALFLEIHDRADPRRRATDADVAHLIATARSASGLARVLVYTPDPTTGSATDPYADDGVPPQLVAQIEFEDIVALENALAPDGALQPLGRPDAFPGLAGAPMTQQAMIVRRWSTPDPVFRNPPGTPHTSYLVTYPGPAADRNAWVAYYIAHHQPVMATFPGIRRIEIATRVDWTSFLPIPRADAMLRNRVVFDSGAALAAALHSPVRDAMRADFAHFPAFAGGNTHFAMATRVVAAGG